MAMICKYSGYRVDPDAAEVKDFDGLNTFTHHLHTEYAPIDNWSDDHPLNFENPDLSECEKYFHSSEEYSHVPSQRAIVLPGQKWRHFKVGKVVEVLAVSIDTECPTQRCVVYKAPDGVIWHRPLDMFLSPVDKEKYPENKQEWRFELVKE